jgi:hypothetical protein
VARYHIFWTKERALLKSEFETLVEQNPGADAQVKELFKVQSDIEDVAGNTPASVGESEEWVIIVNTAEETGENYCKALHGKKC